MSLSTSNLKIKFLGIIPVFKDETGVLNPQEIVALSGLLTFSGKSIENVLKEITDKGENLNDKIKNILRKSSLIGHASMSTTPVLSFSYEASKFLDSGLTGIVFASAIMASGRRTDTTINDIVYPSSISENEKASEIYRIASEKNINILNWLLGQGVQKDEASKILQYGIYGTGIIQLPIESIVSLKREYEVEKEWMPEEIGMVLKEVGKELKKFGVDLLYATRVVAPRNTYPFPSIFRDPKEISLVRDIAKKKKSKEDFQIVSSDFVVTPALKKRLDGLKKEIEEAVKDRTTFKDKWIGLLEKRQQIARDYGLSANIKMLSSVAWRVWGDKKRHRTVPMVVESVYYCAERAVKVFNKYKTSIKDKKVSPKMIDALNSVFSIPPSVRNNKEFLCGYLGRALDSLEVYSRLISMGVRERDAIFVIPRGLRIDVVQDYNLFNLIAGYYPLRTCSTVEEELRRLSLKEVIAIKNLLKKKKLGWLAEHIAPKCFAAGFCLENKCCGAIKALTKDYDEQFHKEMMKDLESKFQTTLGEL